MVFMLVVAVVMMVVVVQCPPGRNLWQPPPSLSLSFSLVLVLWKAATFSFSPSDI